MDQAKELIRERAARKKQSEGTAQGDGAGESGADLAAMRKTLERRLESKLLQRAARLNAREQQMLIRQQSERLALHRAQLREAGRLLFRARRAVADLIGKTPGLRSVLGPIQKLTHLDPAERHRKENDALQRRHEREKRDEARQRRMAARLEVRERQALERRLKRAQTKSREMGQPLTHEFFEAARDYRARQKSYLPKGKVSASFNDAGELAEGRAEALAAEAEDARDDALHQARSWKQRTEELDEADERRRSRKSRRGRRTGYQRDDD